MTIEPHLQPLTEESLSHNSAITDEGARHNISMHGFWGGRFNKAFLDIRVFNPCAQSNHWSPLTSVHRQYEQEKKIPYEQRVCEVEHATFTPFVTYVSYWMCR